MNRNTGCIFFSSETNFFKLSWIGSLVQQIKKFNVIHLVLNVDCMIFYEHCRINEEIYEHRKTKIFLRSKFMGSSKCNVCRIQIIFCTQITIITPIIWGVFTLINYIILGWNSWTVQLFNRSDDFSYCILWSRYLLLSSF